MSIDTGNCIHLCTYSTLFSCHGLNQYLTSNIYQIQNRLELATLHEAARFTPFNYIHLVQSPDDTTHIMSYSVIALHSSLAILPSETVVVSFANTVPR